MMLLDEVTQLLLFHIYLETDKLKQEYKQPRNVLWGLLKDYDVGAGVIDAAINDLNSNGRVASSSRAHTTLYSITSNGIREVQSALTEPASLLIRSLNKYRKDNAEILNHLKIFPASDRIVRRDDNSVAFDGAGAALDEAIEAVERGNDLGDLTAGERSVVLSDFKAWRGLLNEGKVRVGAYLATLQPTLEWVKSKAAGTLIEKAIDKALDWFLKLIGAGS
jgi:DNA-binding PadR family transcriptional regulator